MKLKYEREAVVEYCRKLIDNNLTVGTGGNISIFDRQQGLFALSPSGMDYFEIIPEDVVVLDLKGSVVEGSRKPSVEFDLHKIFYERRDDINSVVHAHSIFATTLSTLRRSIPPCHYLIAFSGENVRCIDYYDFGSRKLAEEAYKGMIDRNSVLLGNHGLLSGGSNVKKAFTTAEELEFVSQIYYRSLCVGEPILLKDKDMLVAKEKFKTYGTQKK